MQDIEKTNYDYRIQVTGKTGARIISVVWCGTYLESWLAKRPKKNQPAKSFFYSMQDPHELISYTDITDQIERLAKLAGITRGINMYLFRHTKMALINVICACNHYYKKQ